MDNNSIPKLDKQSIYEIYRACRLCGAGAGYKMPIIQNVVDLDSNEVELQQKIRDCVQIEINADDKMPPLICELCVDKVNDFYEFMDMCQLTNKRTRTRLGLPLQTSGKVRSTNYDSDCILGVTEQVYGNEDSDEPLSTSKRPKAEPKVKIKVEKDLKKPSDNSKDSLARVPDNVKLRTENKSRTECKSSTEKKTRAEISRETRSRVENTRNSRSRNENSRDSRSGNDKVRDSRSGNDKVRDSRSGNDKARDSRSGNDNTRESRGRNVKESPSRVDSSRESSESRLSDTPRVTRQKRPPTPPRFTRNAKVAQDENVSLSTLKQQVKMSPPAPKSILKRTSTVEERTKRPREPPRPEVPPKKVKLAATFACSVCRRAHSTAQALGNHMRSHVVTYTNAKLSCNACRLWFPTGEDAASHHRIHKARHKPYRCTRCDTSFKLQQGYDDHITNNECIPWEEVPDVKCSTCWRLYPTQNLLDQHRCGGVEARPGGKCMKCKRVYTLLKNLKKHEETCTVKRKSNPIVDPEVERRLLPMCVRLVRCDTLLYPDGGRYDVSAITQGFGLDPGHPYPYLRRAPALPRDLMVSIKAEIHDLDDHEPFVHWDSEDSDEERDGTVDSLTTLSLKKIFSRQLLGKVPRKRRKVKTEKNAYDTILDASEFDMSKDIHNIIEHLGDDDDYVNFDKHTSDVNDNDSLNSESLLCDNDASVDIHSKKIDFDNHDSNSLSLFNNEHTDSFDIDSKLEKDKDSISTDCETEAEDVKENEEARLSNENGSGIDFKDSNEERYFKGLITDSNVHKEIDSNNIDDSNDTTERRTNGEVNEKIENLIREHMNELEDDKKLINDLDEQIGESNDITCENNDKNDDEIVLENHDKKDDEEGKESHRKKSCHEALSQCNETENYENYSTNEQINDGTVNESLTDNNEKIINNVISEINTEKNYTSVANDEFTNKKITEFNDEMSTENHKTLIANDDNFSYKERPEVEDNRSTENHDIAMANDDLTDIEMPESNDKTADLESKMSIDHPDENEAMCNDIENKINDLIALRNHTENNDWNHSENNDGINENSRNVSSYKDSVSLPQNNDFDKEKIALHDLLPHEDSNLKSMDLDSISDEDFDFDA